MEPVSISHPVPPLPRARLLMLLLKSQALLPLKCSPPLPFCAAAFLAIPKPSIPTLLSSSSSGCPAAMSGNKKLQTLETPSVDPPPEVKKPEDPSLELLKKCSDFDPRAAASWKDGKPVPFLFLARALELGAPGRIAMTEILCNAFRTVIATTPKDLLPAVYLSANRIAPPQEGLGIRIGDSYLINAIAEAYGKEEELVREKLEEWGDLGLVANAAHSYRYVKFGPDPLTIAEVYDTLRAIAECISRSGEDNQREKWNLIRGLLVVAKDCEPQYIIRLLQSKMRIGLAEETVLVALGQAAVYSEKLQASPAQDNSPLEEAAKIIKEVYSLLPDYDKIVPTLLRVGVWKLPEECNFSLGVPVEPMLAKPTKAVSEILDKFQGIDFTCEYKYDGERAQIHYMESGTVEIYSRYAERNTFKYPDVVNAVSRFKKPTAKSFVLDCEIVAFDREKQKILSFQTLNRRARKGVILSEIKVQVCTYVFDVLYINGRPLLKDQLKVRREVLYDYFEEVPGVFQFATATTSNDLEEIQKFLDNAVNSSCEGLIIKTLDKDATYEPAKRSNNWLMLKKDYMDSMVIKMIPREKPYYRYADTMNPYVA